MVVVWKKTRKEKAKKGERKEEGRKKHPDGFLS